MQHQRYWLHSDGTVDNRAFDFEQPRPVAVIDSEDPEQFDRLVDLVREGLGLQLTIRRSLREALREYANPTPPKPDEPTGLGAVVRDKGKRWVRVDEHGWWRCEDDGRRYGEWSEFSDAVEKLSEGVS